MSDFTNEEIVTLAELCGWRRHLDDSCWVNVDGHCYAKLPLDPSSPADSAKIKSQFINNHTADGVDVEFTTRTYRGQAVSIMLLSDNHTNGEHPVVVHHSVVHYGGAYTEEREAVAICKAILEAIKGKK